EVAGKGRAVPDRHALPVERLDERADAAVDFGAIHAVAVHFRSITGAAALCHPIAAEKRFAPPLVKRGRFGRADNQAWIGSGAVLVAPPSRPRTAFMNGVIETGLAR